MPDDVMSERRQDILNAIRASGRPMTPKEIAEAVAWEYQSVRVAVRDMLRDGLLEQPAYGKYALPSHQGDRPKNTSASPRPEPEEALAALDDVGTREIMRYLLAREEGIDGFVTAARSAHIPVIRADVGPAEADSWRGSVHDVPVPEGAEAAPSEAEASPGGEASLHPLYILKAEGRGVLTINFHITGQSEPIPIDLSLTPSTAAAVSRKPDTGPGGASSGDPARGGEGDAAGDSKADT